MAFSYEESVRRVDQGSGVFVRTKAKAPTKRERERALRARAQKLSVEAKQMGVEREFVLRIVAEELDALESRARPGKGTK